MTNTSYLKKHTEALVKDVGIEAACALTGKSKATLGRYYSDSDEHDDRFMPIDVVAELEAAARFPHVTAALADLRGITLSYDGDKHEGMTTGVNQDVGLQPRYRPPRARRRAPAGVFSAASRSPATRPSRPVRRS
jgi:hypothetical protein